MECNELVNLTADFGALILTHGGEVYRAQETVERVCAVYDKGNVNVFAIPSYVIVNLTDKDGKAYTGMRHIKSRNTDFDKLSRLNKLSRMICETKPDADTIGSRLKSISSIPDVSFPVEVICYAIVSCTFSLFFGGTFADAAAAMVIGALLKCLTEVSLKFNSGTFLHSLVCSCFTALLAFSAYKSGLAAGYDKIIIGVLMNLVPGVTITNCMRDFIVGDFLAGIYTMVEALLTALGIALGITATISMMIFFFGA